MGWFLKRYLVQDELTITLLRFIHLKRPHFSRQWRILYAWSIWGSRVWCSTQDYYHDQQVHANIKFYHFKPCFIIYVWVILKSFFAINEWIKSINVTKTKTATTTITGNSLLALHFANIRLLSRSHLCWVYQLSTASVCCCCCCHISFPAARVFSILSDGFVVDLSFFFPLISDF